MEAFYGAIMYIYTVETWSPSASTVLDMTAMPFVSLAPVVFCGLKNFPQLLLA